MAAQTALPNQLRDKERNTKAGIVSHLIHWDYFRNLSFDILQFYSPFVGLSQSNPIFIVCTYLLGMILSLFGTVSREGFIFTLIVESVEMTCYYFLIQKSISKSTPYQGCHIVQTMQKFRPGTLCYLNNYRVIQPIVASRCNVDGQL